MSAVLRRGVYAVTRDGPHPGGALETAVAQALDGGVVAIQYRDKTGDADRRRREAGALLELCRARNVPFIVNDDLALAAAVGADGVHLGRDDAPLETARVELGADAIIGVSCYASLERAASATDGGADYVAFGSFFPSPTKPGAPPCPVSVLEAARDSLTIPVVAIGGITAQNGAALIDAGADLLAVIDAVFGQPDVRAAAVRMAALFG